MLARVLLVPDFNSGTSSQAYPAYRPGEMRRHFARIRPHSPTPVAASHLARLAARLEHVG